MKRFLSLTLLCLLFAFTYKTNASHLVGSDITWACTGTPGVYKFTVTIYRDCAGIPFCGTTCGAPCQLSGTGASLEIRGDDPSCSGTLFGTVGTLNLIKVEDVNIDPLCPNSKNTCTNRGCVIPGTYTPAVEKYVFEGNINLNTGSFGIPANCCRLRISYDLCCRNGAINSGAAGQNFHINAIIDRCAAANSPCNSSPILTNDPYVVMCAGQPYVFNNGALDPDFDSLSFSFTASLQGPGSSVNYNAPLTAQTPMPWVGPASAPFPAGIRCDPLTGDIMFTPLLGSGGQFIGVMAIQVIQWRYINGVATNIGVTRRDIQMVIKTCQPNNPPFLLTKPPDLNSPNQPRLNWEVCGDNQLCFEIVARDLDFFPPFNTPQTSDTTYLSWNNALGSLGATFLPKYNPANRRKPAPIGGPRQDSFEFCWTPAANLASNTPYMFTVRGRDSRCPDPGSVQRAFTVKVLQVADVTIQKTDLKCGNWRVGYIKNKPSQVFTNTYMQVSKVPNDFTLSNTFDFNNIQTVTLPRFMQGGKYLVFLSVDMPGPYGLSSCRKLLYDTIFVDTAVAPFVRDTFTCIGSSVNIPYSGRWGTKPYLFSWYVAPDTFFTPVSTNPIATNITLQPTTTTRYVLKIIDANGCRGYDTDVVVRVMPLPTFLQPDSQRLCFGSTWTLDKGNNGGNLWDSTKAGNKPFDWKLLGSGATISNSRTITRSDSNTFLLIITDSFGCKNRDTFNLYVNQPVIPNAGNDTIICHGDTATLRATGGQLYLWRNLESGQVVSPKSRTANVRVTPPNNNTNGTTLVAYRYEVTAFVSYPDTITPARYLECSKTDTVIVTVRPLPKITRPAALQACRVQTSNIIFMPPVTVVPSGGTGVWSYPQAPGAVSLSGTLYQVRTDSLKLLPPDSLAPTSLDNWIRFRYTSPLINGGCVNTDSMIVRIFANPRVNAGPRAVMCVNDPVFKVSNNINFIYSPADPDNKNETWTGPGLSSSPTPGGGTAYVFNPRGSGVNTLPTGNIMTYKFGLKYTSGPLCEGSDTTIFQVKPVPAIEAGKLPPLCETEPVFLMSSRAGAATTPIMGRSFWTASNDASINPAIKDSQNFDASLAPVPATADSKLWKLYYRNITDGCTVFDSAYIQVWKSPKTTLTYRIGTPLKDSLVCFKTGNYSIFTTSSPAGASGAGFPNTTFSGNPAFAANTSNPTQGVFNTDAVNLDLTDNIVRNPIQLNTIYTIRVGLDSSNGNADITCSVRDSALITVQEPPSIAIQKPVNPNCADSATFFLSLSDPPKSPYGFSWQHNGSGYFFGGGDTNQTKYQTSPNDVIKGGLVVKAQTTAYGPCPIKADSIGLTINPLPQSDFYCINCEGCVPLTASVAVKPTHVENATFKWFENDILASTDSLFNRTYSIFEYGKYALKVQVTSNKGCSTYSAPRNIIAHAIPKADFNRQPEVTTIAKPFFDFINASIAPDNANMNYTWSLGNDPQTGKPRFSNDVSPRDIAFAADTSTSSRTPVSLLVVTEFGCRDSITKTIQIDPDITVFIPSAFYPGSTVPCPNSNFDSDCNSKFKVAADGYMTIEIFVFNRWGQRVFFTNNANIAWNGRIENTGEECQQDVYVYQVNASSYNGKKYTYSGSVTLFR